MKATLVLAFATFSTTSLIREPRGYPRGELPNSIGLAPGEQLTLEAHSWDKSTYKSERELMEESELKVAESVTERDVRTVARQSSGHLSAGAELMVKGVPVNLGGTLDATFRRRARRYEGDAARR